MCTSILQKPTPFWVLGLCVCVCEREREREREDLALKPYGIANKSFFAPVKGLGFRVCLTHALNVVRSTASRFTLVTQISVVKCERANRLLPLLINHGIKYSVFEPLWWEYSINMYSRVWFLFGRVYITGYGSSGNTVFAIPLLIPKRRRKTKYTEKWTNLFRPS